MSSAAMTMITLARRSQEWLRSRPALVDVLFAGLMALLALADLSGEGVVDRAHEPDALGVFLVLIAALALVWRRVAPVMVLVFIVGVTTVFYVRDYSSFMAAVALAALYAVTVHENNRRRAWLALGAAFAILFGVASFTVLYGPHGYRWSNAVSMALLVSATILAGGLIRNKEEIFADTKARAERAEADRKAEAERAVTRERLRIAREMHDVVAHGMSLATVQAAAAQEVAHTDPDRAISLMHSVEITGREALNEMRRMLGVLRKDGDAGAGLSPQPTLREISDAVTQSTTSGIATELEVTGRRRDLSPGIELTAYRIVQEALTNVRKHAGATASAVVHLDFQPTVLTIEIIDDGAGAVSALSRTGGGNGHIGMRERIEIYGGDFSAGPRLGGGYRVHVRLPLDTTDARPSVVSAAAHRPGQPES